MLMVKGAGTVGSFYRRCVFPVQEPPTNGHLQDIYLASATQTRNRLFCFIFWDDKKGIVKPAHTFLPSRTSHLAPKSQTQAENATRHRQQRRTMSGNGRLTQQQSTSAPAVEGRTVWVPSTLFRRQLVNLFSHNVSGGGEFSLREGRWRKAAAIGTVGKYTETKIHFSSSEVSGRRSPNVPAANC